jgi:glycosyltransferase involved in cell wall biosynthesis
MGGVESVSSNLARALARCKEVDVHVVTIDPEAREPERQEWFGVTIHRLPQELGPLLRFVTGTGGRMVREYLQNLTPDVLHAHDTFGIMTRGMELPRVFTIHGFIHEDTRYEGGLKARLRSALWKREELTTWAEQPHIISISPYVRERLRGIARGVIHDIENPIDEACFEVERRGERGRIFSSAVISRRKNTLGLAQAVAGLPGGMVAELRLAGPIIEDSYGHRLKTFIHERGLVERVRLLGSVPAKEVRVELGRAAVFALVSFEEGAPMGVAEAMAAGVPILTSNRCGMPYMVRHGETGFLVNPEDPADITRHLSEILKDDALRLSMGRAARAFALDHFHPERVAERTLRVYRRAMEG